MNEINIYFEDTEYFEIDRNKIETAIEKLIIEESKMIGEVSVILCSDDYLLQINKQYLDHDYYTDIVTFDYVKDNIISGDLYISTDRIKENAGKYDVDFSEELYRVVFHGILHLSGYDDKTDEEKDLIRSKENYYIEKLVL